MITLRRLVPNFDTEHGITEEMLEGLEVGNMSFAEAMKRIKPSTGRECFATSPTCAGATWGLDEAKQVLREAIEWPLRHGDLFLQIGTTPPKGILLSGSPGSGKTLLAKAVAKESGVNFIAVKGPRAPVQMGRGVGAIGPGSLSQGALSGPCIIFFDEIDALCPVRGSGSSDSGWATASSANFTEMDGIEELGGRAGGNESVGHGRSRASSPGRFDLVVDLPVPDRDTRGSIFAVHTQGKPLAPDVDLNTLAEFSEGLMGGDIASICRRATMHAIRDHVEHQGESQGVLLSPHHFRHAMEAVMKSSQYARAQRFLREIPLVERAPGEQQQTLSEAKPMSQRTSPLA